MITIDNLNKSSKAIGKYERPILQIASKYFKSRGVSVMSHTRLNVAWSNVFSDIDILMLKKNLISAIEIKSHRDNLHYAFNQIHRIKDFVDYEMFPVASNIFTELSVMAF
jgi:hypothetical protein